MSGGGSVVPAAPVPPEARDQSCGRMRSSYGPSVRRTNATDTVRWPAFTLMGALRT